MKTKTRTVGRAGDAQAPQDTEEMGDSFGDVGCDLTPPSTFAELNSFLSQAKRASYSRPSNQPKQTKQLFLWPNAPAARVIDNMSTSPAE